MLFAFGNYLYIIFSFAFFLKIVVGKSQVKPEWKKMIVILGKKPVITRTVMWTKLMKKIIICQVLYPSYSLGTILYTLAIVVGDSGKYS